MTNTQHTNPTNTTANLGQNDPALASTSAAQFLETDSTPPVQTTATVSRRRSPALWIGAAGLVFGFGIGQLSLLPTDAVAESAAVVDESDSTNKQELNRTEALADLARQDDFSSHDVAEARRMHTLRQVLGANNHDCDALALEL